MIYETEYSKAFNYVVSRFSEIIKDALDKTEKDLGHPLNDVTKKLCVVLGCAKLFSIFLEDNL